MIIVRGSGGPVGDPARRYCGSRKENIGDRTWIDKKTHTAVQAARAYIGLDGPDGEPEG